MIADGSIWADPGTPDLTALGVLAFLAFCIAGYAWWAVYRIVLRVTRGRRRR